MDVVLIQEHKLRGSALDHIGTRLMPDYASWVLEAALEKEVGLTPTRPVVGILLNPKYAKLVTEHGGLHDNPVVWIKMEEVEGGNIGVACVYALNIPTDRRHLWYLMMESLLNDCDWIVGGNFNITERPYDKSNDCGHALSDLERGTWNGLLDTFQIQDFFHHEGGPRYSWSNGQSGIPRRLARLDRFYIPKQNRLDIHHKTYYIHGYTVGFDHSPIQMELTLAIVKLGHQHLYGMCLTYKGIFWTCLMKLGPAYRLKHHSFPNKESSLGYIDK